ncbi:MAG: hypothetical protein HQM11_16730 [SAR324 cluster bacterium]|nr:hypothetical protein [SAR324 cluster bacterium]
MDSEIVRGSQCKGFRGEDGIVRMIYETNAQLVLEDARNNVELVNKLTGNKKRPLLVDARHSKSVDKAARAYLASEGAKNLSAFAILVESPLSRMIGNFFIGLDKGPIPTRLFTSETEALRWLGEFLQ